MFFINIFKHYTCGNPATNCAFFLQSNTSKVFGIFAKRADLIKTLYPPFTTHQPIITCVL